MGNLDAKGVALAALVMALAVPRPAQAAAAQHLVPANFMTKMDSMGFRWEIQSYGNADDGTDGSFDYVAILSIGGNRFESGRAMMTPDGSEYIIPARQGMLGQLDVTRRVKVDVKACAARFVEVVRNPGAAPATVHLELASELDNTCDSVLSDSGIPTAGMLRGRDCGIVAFQNPGGCPSVLFCLAGPKSKVKPTITVRNHRSFLVSYPLTVPPGGTASVMHVCAQRRFTGAPGAVGVAAQFKPLQLAAFARDLPADVRRTVVNLGTLSLGGPDFLANIESLGVARGASDVLAIGTETRLRGTAAAESLVVKTRYGPATLPLDKVAAITGERHTGRSSLVFLRDGQILTGPLEARGLRFAMASGASLELNVGTLDRLVFRAAEGDGKPPEGAHFFTETYDGDRLAASRGEDLRLAASTPWGRLDVPLDDVVWLAPPEDGPPGHLVRLRDGSRFFGLLDGPPLKLKTLAFGVREFPVADLRSLATADARQAADAEDQAIAQPHVVLLGGNTLVGRLDLPALRLVAAGQVVPVAPSQLRTLHNTTEPDAVAPPVLKVELWGGGTVEGEYADGLLPIRVGDRLCQVPVRDVVDVVVPSPTVPEGMRDKIAALVRDLGHPEWEKRDAATRQLGELGFVAKPQLEEALKQADDPEVRRRVRALLDEMSQ
ncbi:MAG: hypothetical protein FJ290_03235 [Planctomycetes bacterium]|nr:hypothetical protein [Planctomycetota bacterium]